MIRLMNSAMMPRPGVYVCEEISFDKFKSLLKTAHSEGILESYIGYQANLDLIKAWTGISLPMSREKTEVNDGDFLLVMKLKYRIQNPNEKGKFIPKECDFEFYLIKYKEKGECKCHC